MPDSAVAAAREDLQPAIRVASDRLAGRSSRRASTSRSSRCWEPSATYARQRRRRRERRSPVGHRHCFRCTFQVDPAAERVPPAPAVIRSRLPVMPDSAVATAGEDLQAAIRVSRNLQQVDPAAKRVPTAPAVRSGASLARLCQTAPSPPRAKISSRPSAFMADVQQVDPTAERVPAAPAVVRGASANCAKRHRRRRARRSESSRTADRPL